jgi:hypothetical protein
MSDRGSVLCEQSSYLGMSPHTLSLIAAITTHCDVHTSSPPLLLTHAPPSRRPRAALAHTHHTLSLMPVHLLQSYNTYYTLHSSAGYTLEHS